MSKAIKHDNGKPDLSHISLELMEEVAKVREFGAKKYSRNNWKKGFKVTRSLAAALRHIMAFLSGQTKDPESGLSHLGHAVCCLEHAIYDMRHHPENDDRVEDKVAEPLPIRRSEEAKVTEPLPKEPFSPYPYGFRIVSDINKHESEIKNMKPNAGGISSYEYNKLSSQKIAEQYEQYVQQSNAMRAITNHQAKGDSEEHPNLCPCIRCLNIRVNKKS